MEIRFDEMNDIAYIKLSGQLSKETIIAAFDEAVSHEKYKKGMSRLWDFRDADLSSISSKTVVEMAQYSKNFPPGINDVKVAFVVSNVLEYGMTRMFAMSSTGDTPIRVFK